MKQEITVVRNQEVLGKDFKVYGDIFEPLFLAKDVADMIGHSKVSMMLEGIDEDEKLKEVILTSGQKREMWFLTESGLYEVLMQSRKPIAKDFKKEVKAILKDLRLTGVVITESATTEAIDFAKKFGNRRLRKTIRETDDVRKLFDEYMELSAIERNAKRITNKERIAACNIFSDELENKLANEALTLRGSELLGIQELLTDIANSKTTLSNRANGGRKSAMTKRIAQLENTKPITQDEYYFIDAHPFSNNFMYQNNMKTPAYNRWINKLNLEKYLPQTYPNLDITKPMEIKLSYGHMSRFDTTNFEKSIIDQVSAFYGFNDRLIYKATQELNSHVDSYEEGYIYVSLENL